MGITTVNICIQVFLRPCALISLGNVLVEWLDNGVGRCLTFTGTAQSFSKGGRPFYVPSSRVQEFQLLLILASTWCGHSFHHSHFILAVLIGVWCYFVVVLICLSLVTNDGTATFSQWKKAKSVQETQRGAQGCRKKSRKKTWHPRSQQEKCFKKAVVKRIE